MASATPVFRKFLMLGNLWGEAKKLLMTEGTLQAWILVLLPCVIQSLRKKTA